MRRTWLFIFSLVLCAGIFSSIPSAFAEETKDLDTFVPYDPGAHEAVDSKQLVATAYGVIIGLLLFYSLSVLLRQRRCQVTMLVLKKRIEDQLDKRSNTQQ